jgi:hypothetical protein
VIDLLATSAMERDTEISYIRRERDWLDGNGHAGAHGGNGQHAH